MIKHVVFFKLKEEAEGATKEENLDRIYKTLAGLPAKISEIKLYDHGKNFTESPRAWDYCLISGFDSVEDLDSYRVHPDHKNAVEFIKKLVTEMSAVDFED